MRDPLPLICLALAFMLPACGESGTKDPQVHAPPAESTDAGPDGAPPPGVPRITGNFSFFVTSLQGMQELSGSQDGFGGNLGGLTGADSICQRIAWKEGAGHKTWRAFLSATQGASDGGPVHAALRIGEGPWYDRLGRLVAENRESLLAGDRPPADPAIVDNLPNERGEPLNQNDADDHDVMTGSDARGMLFDPDPARTCLDWTTTETTADIPPIMLGPFVFPARGPMCGHDWPGFSGVGFVQAHPAPGCAAGATLIQLGPPAADSQTVGGGGGYGGIYCFALTP